MRFKNKFNWRWILLALLVAGLSSPSLAVGEVDFFTISPKRAYKQIAERRLEEIRGRAEVKRSPNEAGYIPVLMYHRIGPVEERYTRSFENFWADLEVLYELGYRPVRISDYVEGNIELARGLTPVVLTFDDGNESDIAFDDRGELIFNTACGMLLDFAKDKDDFEPHAVFYPYKGGIGEPEECVRRFKYLIDNGMDIGNHSYNHPDMTNMTAQKIICDMALQHETLKTYLPEGYEIKSSSIPYSVSFKTSAQTAAMAQGKCGNREYEYTGVVGGGWMPNESPYCTIFNPIDIKRIVPTDKEFERPDITLDYNLKLLESGEIKRFISDGNRFTITVPKESEGSIDAMWKIRMVPAETE